MLRSIGKQSGECVESVLKMKKRLQREEFAERKALTEYGNPLVYMILSAY